MDRRDFLKTAAISVAAVGLGKEVFAQERYSPSKVDWKLFDSINRIKDPANKTVTEKKHAPVIKAPAEVKAGMPFTVEVSVGEILHDLGPAHWIQWVELNIGNEPAGRVDFQAKGYMKPVATFSVVLGQEFVSLGKVTLIANERCNLHGIWESHVDVKVAA